MGFQELKPVEDASFYLDLAIKRANKNVSLKKVRGLDKFQNLKTLELVRIDSFRNTLVGKLNSIAEQYNLELNDFYSELLDITVGSKRVRQAVKNINWSVIKIDDLYKHYSRKIKSAKEAYTIHRFKKEFYGRVSSIVKKVDFDLLKATRTAVQSFPVIRDKLTKVAIAGFPNVGKTTLLAKLSGSKPEIATYPFTTKKTMIGYVSKDGKKVVQLLDTPGTLDRPDKMNFIEKQAYLIMQKAADKIIYVFDLTEPYPLEKQIKLYKKIKEFGKPVIVYLSKTDMMNEKEYQEFAQKNKALTDAEKLKKLIS